MTGYDLASGSVRAVWIIVLVILGIGLISGFGIGVWRERAGQQNKAIEAGVGRWVIDPQTGEREFKYGVQE